MYKLESPRNHNLHNIFSPGVIILKEMTVLTNWYLKAMNFNHAHLFAVLKFRVLILY